jgi:YhcH/YjgK/YiaL family protein
MIIDRIENCEKYTFLGPRFEKAFHLLKTVDFSPYEPGKYETDLEGVHFLVQDYQSKDPLTAKKEAHKRYADLQAVLAGREYIGYADLSMVELGDYLEEKDFQQISGKMDMVTVPAGFFMLLFPQDAHMPGVRINESEPVCKVVFKILL